MIDIETIRRLRETDPEIKAGGWESTTEIIARHDKLGETAIRRELHLCLKAGVVEQREFQSGGSGRPLLYWREVATPVAPKTSKK